MAMARPITTCLGDQKRAKSAIKLIIGAYFEVLYVVKIYSVGKEFLSRILCQAKIDKDK
jgi:hypothetical protein